MRRLGVVALVLAAAAVAAPVRAADMALPPSYYPPAAALPPVQYNWNGIYVGGHIGAGLLFDTVSQSALTPTSTNLFGTSNISAGGAIGGAQIGINYQLASVVVGAEVSWTASAITGSSTSSATGVAPIFATQERATSAPLWFAAATGRVGYAFNSFLPYVKGGGALMDVGYTQDQLLGGVVATTQSISGNRVGYTAGIGFEYGMTENLSAKLEYDFYGFGSKNYAFTQTPVAISSDLQAILVGLNYRFNWDNGTAVERCPTC